jgi:hypothetical protein
MGEDTLLPLLSAAPHPPANAGPSLSPLGLG